MISARHLGRLRSVVLVRTGLLPNHFPVTFLLRSLQDFRHRSAY
jgi:hypothetical protein